LSIVPSLPLSSPLRHHPVLHSFPTRRSSDLTVPFDDKRWQSDPFSLTEKNNRWYGLGTCDMKGFFPLAIEAAKAFAGEPLQQPLDRKSTRLNSSHVKISYAVFCLKKKKKTRR